MNFREVNDVRMDMRCKIFHELFDMCKRYLESLKIKIGQFHYYLYRVNCYAFKFNFKERMEKDMVVNIYLLPNDLIDRILLNFSDKTDVIYTKYYKSLNDSYGRFMKNYDINTTRKLFIPAEKFVNYINHIYNKFYNTDYYNNLQSVTTFLLICKHNPIFPKDIYLIIAKKIFFFIVTKKKKTK